MEEDGRYYYGLGIEALERGDVERSLEYFEQSARIEPHFKTYERISQCYKKLNKIVQAREYIEKAFDLNQNNDKIAVEYAEFLLNEDQIESAENLINDILKRNSSYGPAIKLLKKLKIM